MNGRNYRNHRIISVTKLRDITANMKAMCRAKSTPEITRLQFQSVISAIERTIEGSDLLMPLLKQMEIQAVKKIEERRTNKKNYNRDIYLKRKYKR